MIEDTYVSLVRFSTSHNGARMSVSGFDLGLTIACYHKNKRRLRPILPQPQVLSPISNCVVQAEKTDTLHRTEIHGILALLPEAARARSALTEIRWFLPRWFHRDSLVDSPKTTLDVREALSATAIIPSYVSYNSCEGVPHLSSAIALYTTQCKLHPHTEKILYTQALLHEVVHSVVTPTLYRNIPILLDGVVVDSSEFLFSLIEDIAQAGPISHYSSAYWDGGKLKEGLTPLNEELTELMTAYLLGFVVRPDCATMHIGPLAEIRPTIAMKLAQFLHAPLAM